MGRKLKTGAGAARASELVPRHDGEEVPAHEVRDPGVAEIDGVDIDETTLHPGGENRTVGQKSVRTVGRWGEVTETILAVGDQKAMYDRLVAGLSLGDGATQYGEILASADISERSTLDASRLHRAARLEEESVRLEVQKREEVLRTAAREELDREKSEGKRSKAPTIQDVDDRTVANWPDEVASLRRGRDEIHAVVEVTERLEMAWRSRSATLREMLARYAPTRIA